MELDSSQTESYGLFAAVLRNMEKFDEAEDFGRRAIEQFPKEPGLLCEPSNTLQYQFEFEEAEKYAREVLKITPHHGPALDTLAIVLIHTGSEEEVLELYKTALREMPDERTVNFNYALTLFCYGYLEEAWKQYKKYKKVAYNL